MKEITKEVAEKIVEEVEKSDFFLKFGSTDTWVSGSSTIVYPIMVWKNEIEIQLKSLKSYKGRAATFRRLIKRLQKSYPTITGTFVKYDGSCRDTYSIYFKA